MAQKKETISKASKGFIEDYYNTAESIGFKWNMGENPKFEPKKALEIIREDSTVVAALNTLVDKSLEKDWRAKNKTTREKLKKLRIDKLIRQTFFNLYLYNNVYIENVKNGNGEVKELHILETTLTEPVSNEHGKVQGYKQIVPEDSNTTPAEWTPEEVTHIAATKVSTSIWGEIDIQSLYTIILIKQYIKKYLGWIFGTNQFRPFYNIKEANEEQIKKFISYLKKSERDINFPLIAEGEVEGKILKSADDLEKVLVIWEKCDRDIMTLMQVSPIHMGQPDSSNRSSSDEQGRSDNIHIRAYQKLVEESFNYDLFKKIGIKDETFKFNEVDEKLIDRILEQVERMKNVGFKLDVVEEFLEMNNFPIEGKLLDKETYEGSGEKSEDMYDSRTRKQDGDMSEQIGTGEDGTTREDQLVKKAFNGATFNAEEDVGKW